MYDSFYTPLLFVLGAVVGSYLDVVGTRYSLENGYKESSKGRSYCPCCRKKLSWYELIPIISFTIQRGRCRGCKNRVPIRHPLIEIITSLTFVLIPQVLGFSFPALIWLIAFLIFIVLSIIDFRLHIIPNSLNISLAVLSIILISYYFFTDSFGLYEGRVNGSFLNGYAITFWVASGNILINYLLGFIVGITSLGAIYALTKGRGMGFGDVKLSAALGLLMGWPDILLAIILAFFTGAAVGLALLASGKKSLKGSLPFGPFIVLGVTLVFFFGYDILNGYFSTFDVFYK